MKPVIAKRHATRLDTAGLERVLPQIQSLIEGARQHVVSTANLALVWLYWNVGRIITEDIQKSRKRAGYGEQLLRGLAKELIREYGSGYSHSNLNDMRRFFEAFEILQPASVKSGRLVGSPAAAESVIDAIRQPLVAASASGNILQPVAVKSSSTEILPPLVAKGDEK